MRKRHIDQESIAFVGPTPPPLGGVGVMNEAFQEIVKQRWDVLHYNTSGGKLNEDLYKKKNLKNIFHFLRNFIGFTKFLNKTKFTIVNVFVTSNVAFFRDSLFIVLLFLYRKKIVVHFHSKKNGEFFLNPIGLKYVAFIFRFAKKIIVLSDDHLIYFSKFFNKSKLAVIENFVDYTLYDCNVDHKRMDLLYVGRLSEKKGFFDLIEAARILKEKKILSKINVLGTPENTHVSKLITQRINDYELSESIILHGHLFGSKKTFFFKNSSIFVFPSHFENSPVVLKEAIASKMAIVCSDIEANKMILENKLNTSFFSKADAIDLSTKIEDLLMNFSKTQKFMQQSALCKLYDKTVAMEKINSIFIEILRQETKLSRFSQISKSLGSI